MISIRRKPTRTVRIGRVAIGSGHPIAVQTMTATRTTDIEATLAQIERMQAAGADIIRIAVDSPRDAEALRVIRRHTDAVLAVDLQENYRLAAVVAPYVDKIRYNPGHLYHHEKHKDVREKVAWIASVARAHGCALRIGVNCGSVDPEFQRRYPDDPLTAMLECALFHCDVLDSLGFDQYVVSLKDSDPYRVIEVNRRFAEKRPDVPLHLGVTEAGLPPMGIIKTRIAFEALLAEGIGDTLRVSLTLPNDRKHEEVLVGRQIIEDVYSGRFLNAPRSVLRGLNIVSCPSCARVENERFVELAEQVRALTAYAKDYDITIAVMGCRVNGPGETDSADLGLWCGPTHVNLKRGPEKIGTYTYDEILPRLQEELDRLIRQRFGPSQEPSADVRESVDGAS